jgi:putative flippase GtrA
MISGSVASFAARPGARQFVKFCLVGASSFVIDIGLLNLLHYRFGLSVAVAATLSFLAAVCNGFYWNRRWTFKETKGEVARQYPVFVATNVVGWLLNLSIMTLVLVVAGSLGMMHAHHTPMEIIRMIALREGGKGEFNAIALNGAKVVATIIVTAWNFTAAKFLTFRH